MGIISVESDPIVRGLEISKIITLPLRCTVRHRWPLPLSPWTALRTGRYFALVRSKGV